MTELERWVEHVAKHTTPKQVIWWDGSPDAQRTLERQLVEAGDLDALAHTRSVLWRHRPLGEGSHARVLLADTGTAPIGPHQELVSRSEATRTLWPLLRGAMKGRLMYAVPYALGPEGTPHASLGVQLTDSPHLVLLMQRLLRVGTEVRRQCEISGFVRCLHSAQAVGHDQAMACIFVSSRTIWAAGFDADLFMAMRFHGLWLASIDGHHGGWLASPMSVLAVTPPGGEKIHIASLFGGHSGQTHFAALSGRAGWKIEIVGDGVASINAAGDGRLWALPAERGIVAWLSGLSSRTSPQMLGAARRSGLFINAAVTGDRQPFWDDLDTASRERVVIGWNGEGRDDSSCPDAAAHPHARVAFSLREFPHHDDAAGAGVALDAIVFGVRRSRAIPLVLETTDWTHGCYVGAMLAYERAQARPPAPLIVDPMGMARFGALDQNEYLAQWLAISRHLRRPPRIFQVNWYRRDGGGHLLWPGYGENTRVLEWIVNRLGGHVTARATAAGLVPRAMDLAAPGTSFGETDLAEVLSVNPEEWDQEVAAHAAHIAAHGKGFPFALQREHTLLRQRVRDALACARLSKN